MNRSKISSSPRLGAIINTCCHIVCKKFGINDSQLIDEKTEKAVGQILRRWYGRRWVYREKNDYLDQKIETDALLQDTVCREIVFGISVHDVDAICEDRKKFDSSLLEVVETIVRMQKEGTLTKAFNNPHRSIEDIVKNSARYAMEHYLKGRGIPWNSSFGYMDDITDQIQGQIIPQTHIMKLVYPDMTRGALMGGHGDGAMMLELTYRSQLSFILENPKVALDEMRVYPKEEKVSREARIAAYRVQRNMSLNRLSSDPEVNPSSLDIELTIKDKVQLIGFYVARAIYSHYLRWDKIWQWRP